MSATNTTDNHKFVSPVSRTGETAESKDHVEIENKEAKAAAAARKETPVAVRTRRHIQQELHMCSPSDAQLSPCTTKLFAKGGKKITNAPTAVLRNKLQTTIPFNLNE